MIHLLLRPDRLWERLHCLICLYVIGTDYQPVATGGGANVDSQVNFNGSGYQTQGFTAGTAQSAQANKVWRQSSMWAAALGLWVSQRINAYIADDGNVTGLIANFWKALIFGAFINQVVAYNPAAVFDCSQATDFEITLTGNISPTIQNMSPGQLITIIVHQDGAGNHTWTNPGNLPMGAIAQAAGSTTTQSFKVNSAGNLIAFTPPAQS